MSTYELGFIGTGNMGGALAQAVCRAADPKRVLLSNRTRAKAEVLAQKLGCRAADNAAAATGTTAARDVATKASTGDTSNVRCELPARS